MMFEAFGFMQEFLHCRKPISATFGTLAAFSDHSLPLIPYAINVLTTF